MERSRESKRAASAPRRLRISCPKDPADAEARMDETPLIEKVKKGNLQALPASFHATATAWSKRKRNGFQEARHLSEVTNSGKDLAELTPFEEYENESVPGTVNIKQRAKKDELVMNIYNIPRRARSSAARFPSLRQHLEPCFAAASSQQPVATSKQRSPSPRISATKEEKLRPAGMKSRLLKDLTVMESAQISDQEVEVAEVLFDLSRSMPSFVQSTNIKCEEKSHRGLEEEDLRSTSSQVVGNENLEKSFCHFSEQKCKRQRASYEREVTLCMQYTEGVNAKAGCCASGRPSSGMEGSEGDELEYEHGLAKKICCKQPELMTRDIVKEPCHGHSQLHVADDKHTSRVEERGQDNKPSEGSRTHFAGQISRQVSSSLSINKSEMGGQVLHKGGDCSKISSRRHDGVEASGLSSKEDLWCPPQKLSSEEELNVDYDRLALSESSSSLLENCSGKAVYTNNDSVNQSDKVRGAPVKDESRSDTKDVDQRWNQEHSKATLNPVKEELVDIRLLDVRRDEKMMSDASSVGFPLPSTIPLSSSGAATYMGWMGAFPQLNFCSKAGPPWIADCTHLESSAHQAVQLPHPASVQHTVQRIRRCAAHVYVAHFIQQQQQVLRRAFWPTACNPCNVNIMPANQQQSNKLASLQAECGQTSTECMDMRMPSSRGTVSNAKNENCLASLSNPTHMLSVGAGSIKGFGDSKSMMSHTQQFKQTTMQLNGSGTVCMPSSGSPAQSVSIINRSRYPANVSPHNVAHQAPSLSHFPKLQPGHHASLHVGLSHSHTTQPRVQLQQQVQYEQLKQHRSYLTSSPQLYGAGTHGFLEGNRLGFR